MAHGAKRITAEINDPDDDASGASSSAPFNHKRVARLVRASRLVGYTKKRRVKNHCRRPASAGVR
ncbi:MAG: hypothetical protein ACTH1D_08590 [Mycobacteriaceae bacterium]|uniref:hypothetical protein n=1 Tax=Corynebacterium sp. TaxID=1720 RepID=UPI003F9A3460